jgi:hypothetical protein
VTEFGGSVPVGAAGSKFALWEADGQLVACQRWSEKAECSSLRQNSLPLTKGHHRSTTTKPEDTGAMWHQRGRS